MSRSLLLNKNLLIIFGITLMVIMSVSSIMPILPEMAARLGISRAQVGLVIAVFTLPGVVLAPVAGILADRLGRKAVLIPSLVIFALAGGACGLAPDWTSLLALRFVQGIGAAALGVLNMTLIGDLFSGQDRATAMGYNASVLSIGTAGFPAVGGLMSLLGWQAPFYLPLAALPLALLAWIGLDAPEMENGGNFREYLKKAASVMRTRRAIGLFSATFLTFIILYGCLVTYVPILLNARYHAPAHVIGLIISMASAVTAVASSQIGRLTRRFGHLALLKAACVFYAAAMLAMPLAPGMWWTILPITLFGFAQGLNIPSLMTLLTGLAPASQRAAIMAANGMVLRLSQTVAPMLMGLIFMGLGLHWVFFAGAATAACMYLIAKGLIR